MWSMPFSICRLVDHLQKIRDVGNEVYQQFFEMLLTTRHSWGAELIVMEA